MNEQRRFADFACVAMMIAESVNNTFGRTVNPLNRRLTSGGSSGGESALISFGGSVLGVGTDIGESMTQHSPRVRGLSYRSSKGARCFPEISQVI